MLLCGKRLRLADLRNQPSPFLQVVSLLQFALAPWEDLVVAFSPYRC